MSDTKVCTRCCERLPVENFYFVSKRTGVRRGACKPCMVEIKKIQKDPAWRPSCPGCGRERERSGMGRRLCQECFDEKYEAEFPRPGGSHHLRLSPCRSCGAKRLREDHVPNTMLCAVCRSVPQSRRRRLKTHFNMSPREYLELIEHQGYRCAICNRRPTGPWHVDHRHADPPIVRGLTCGRCNTLLGLARDNVETLAGAVRYLEAPPAQAVFPGRVANPEANRKDEGWRALGRRAA